MSAALRYKKGYVGGLLYNRHEWSKKIELETKFHGRKDEIFEQVNTASRIQQSLLNGGSNSNQQKLARALSSVDDSIEDTVSQYSVANLTFKDLIDHVNMIEGNYNVVTKYINNYAQQQQQPNPYN